MKKTLRQWLSQLPEPYKKQAIKYAEENYKGCKDGIDHECIATHLGNALYTSFVWHKTEEGYDYWDKVYDLFGASTNS